MISIKNSIYTAFFYLLCLQTNSASMCKETSSRQSNYCVTHFLTLANKQAIQEFLTERLKNTAPDYYSGIQHELTFLHQPSQAFNNLKKENRALYSSFFKQVEHNYAFIAYCTASYDNPDDANLAQLKKTLEHTTITTLADAQTQVIAYFESLRGYSTQDATSLVTSCSCWSILRFLWEYYSMQKQLSAIDRLIKTDYEQILTASMKKKYGDNYKDTCFIDAIQNLAQACLNNLEQR